MTVTTSSVGRVLKMQTHHIVDRIILVLTEDDVEVHKPASWFSRSSQHGHKAEFVHRQYAGVGRVTTYKNMTGYDLTVILDNCYSGTEARHGIPHGGTLNTFDTRDGSMYI